MKLIGAFLLIFLTGCLEKADNPPTAADPRGSAVVLTEHCQAVAIVDPVQVRKHELPLSLQKFRDECTVIVRAPSHQFSDPAREYFQCSLLWQAANPAANTQMENDIDSIVGYPLAQEILTNGDLDVSESAMGDSRRALFFFIDEKDDPQYVWTQNQLWLRLTTRIETLEDLAWRFDLQDERAGFCTEEARWGITAEAIFVDNVQQCSGEGQAYLQDFVFDESGRLTSQMSRPTDTFSCY